MEVIINCFCFLFGILMGILIRGDFTINYRHIYRDDTIQFLPQAKEQIGYKTEEKNEDKNEDVDSPAEIAEKIQEALGVFIDEPEERN